MTALITHRDETAVATANGYRYHRVVDIAGGHIVRARIERDFYIGYSLAHVEVINDRKSWTHLAEEPTRNWWDTTPSPRTEIDAAVALGPVADQLLRRAVTILAPAPTTPTLSPRLLDAVSALLATTYGCDGERRLAPDDMIWARNHGGTLHVIEHHDGSVTLTKAHRDECPFLASSGTQDCDDECHFQHPAEAQRQLDQLTHQSQLL
jgi:hypothetical protein